MTDAPAYNPLMQLFGVKVSVGGPAHPRGFAIWCKGGEPIHVGLFSSPPASAAASTSVGLTRLPDTFIIASSRPTNRSRPSAPSTAVSPDQTAVPPLAEGREDKGGMNLTFRITKRPPAPDPLVRVRVLPPADDPA